MNCSIAQFAEVMGDKWSLLIMRDAIVGVDTFSQCSTTCAGSHQQREVLPQPLGIPRLFFRRVSQTPDETIFEGLKVRVRFGARIDNPSTQNIAR